MRTVDMDWVAEGVVFLFFWVLIGQYVYREAHGENRSYPILRGIFWAVFGIIGTLTYVAHIRGREKSRLGWLGLSMILVALWAIGTVGLWGLNGGFYLWVGLFAGAFILYWQFILETKTITQSST